MIPTLRALPPYLSVTCALVLTVGSPAHASESLSSVAMNCQQEMVEWAFDPQTHRVFANPYRGSEIVEYSPETGEELRRIRLQSFPAEMLLKSNKIFVCSSHGLQVIDLKTNQRSQFLTHLLNSRAIMSPSATSNHAYLFASLSRQERERELVLLNTETAEVVSRRAWRPQTKRQTPSRFVVSHDERQLLSLGFIKPGSTATLARSYELSDDLRLSFQRELTVPALPVTQTSYGARWLAGNVMLSADLDESLREYSGDLVAFDESRDRFASLTLEDRGLVYPDMVLTIGRISSNEELAHVTLSAPAGSSHELKLEQSSRRLVFPTIQFDSSGRRVLCAYASNCHLVDLANMESETAVGRLEVKPLERNRYAAGLPIAVDLQVTGGPEGVKPVLALADGPAGMRLEDARLVWNPTVADLGRHDVRLTIGAAGHEAAYVLSLVVVLPEVALPVAGQAMITDEAGKYAVVFGQPSDGATAIRTQSRPPSRLAVVDLDRLEVIRQCPVDDWPRTMLISGQSMFWIPKSVDVLKRLDLEQGAEVEDLPLPEGKLEGIFSLRDGSLVLILANEEERSARAVAYRCEGWQSIDDHPLSQLTLPWSPRSFRKDVYRIGDSQLYFYSRVLDEDDGSTLCFCTRYGSGGHRMVKVAEKDFIAMDNRGSYGSVWSREIGSRDIGRLLEPAIIRHTSRTHHLSRSRPLYLSLELEERGHEFGFAMELRDLVFGKSLGKFPLPDDVTFRMGYSHYDRFARIAGDKMVCVIDDRLFYYPLPNLSGQLQPLRMLYPRVSPTPVTEIATVSLAARGGERPYRFRLSKPIAGVTVAPSTATLKVDWPRLWKDFRSRVAAGQEYETIVGWDRPFIGPRSVQTAESTVPAGHTLVSVECLLDVTDVSGQQDRVLVVLLGVAPKQELASEVLKGRQVIESRRKEARESRRRSQQQGSQVPIAQP